MEKNRFNHFFNPVINYFSVLASKNAKLIATWFGCGSAQFMPGTFGSMGAFPIWVIFDSLFTYFMAPRIFIYSFWIILLLFLFFLGAKASTIYSRQIEGDDPSEVVVDEVVGQLIALVFTRYFIYQIFSFDTVTPDTVMIIHIVTAFIGFRIFDITKPLFIRSSETWLKEGYGIMIDDVLAGGVAALIIDFVIILFIMFFS